MTQSDKGRNERPRASPDTCTAPRGAGCRRTWHSEVRHGPGLKHTQRGQTPGLETDVTYMKESLHSHKHGTSRVAGRHEILESVVVADLLGFALVVGTVAEQVALQMAAPESI